MVSKLLSKYSAKSQIDIQREYLFISAKNFITYRMLSLILKYPKMNSIILNLGYIYPFLLSER